MPAISVETLHRVFGVGEAGGAVERDVVVVVEQDELAELRIERKLGKLTAEWRQIFTGSQSADLDKSIDGSTDIFA